VVRDGLLITGQNPASSEPAARMLLEQLAQRSSAA
jgi:putative intracellular protease/amidase